MRQLDYGAERLVALSTREKNVPWKQEGCTFDLDEIESVAVEQKVCPESQWMKALRLQSKHVLLKSFCKIYHTAQKYVTVNLRAIFYIRSPELCCCWKLEKLSVVRY